jgi:triosephosphate isomerase
MAGAIRLVSVERGHDPKRFAYMPFGGGGALHVCAMMREVGVPRGLIPRYPGVTSALGCVIADMRHDFVQTINQLLDELDLKRFDQQLRDTLARGLTPILCVGELLAERESGRTFEVIGRQLDAVLAVSDVTTLARAVIAYEPVWAIGTGLTASPEQAQDVHAFVRGRIATRDATIAAAVPVLYGGSVKAGNAAELFAKPDVDGGLIGGASLKAEEFLAICAAVPAR